jgi:hypothetical protein
MNALAWLREGAFLIFCCIAFFALLIGGFIAYNGFIVPALMNCPENAHVGYEGCEAQSPVCIWDNCTTGVGPYYPSECKAK